MYKQILLIILKGKTINSSIYGNSFWTLMIDLNMNFPCILTVACFHGKGKPKGCIAQFLSDFTKEFQELRENGLQYRFRRISLSIKNIIADAPVGAFLICGKNVNYKYGCHKCCTKAISIERRMVYLLTNKLIRRGNIVDDETG